MRRIRVWLGLVALVATVGGAAAATVGLPATPAVREARDAAGLTAALANDQPIWLRASLAQLEEGQPDLLRAWVERGNTLWTSTDAAALFGFQIVAPVPLERIGRAALAAPPGADPLLFGVRDVFYRLEPGDVLLVGHRTALPLLRIADGPAAYPTPRLIAATLPYGRGQVIHRPTTIHPNRLQGPALLANLERLSQPDADTVIIPTELITAAQLRAVDAARKADRRPEDAKPLLDQVFLAYRLWYADHLTATGQYEQAVSELKAVSEQAPEDPALYLAVARLNEAVGHADRAAEAQARAEALYRDRRQPLPQPDDRRLRIAWAEFTEGINQAGEAWETPTEAGAQAVAARLGHWLALDVYRQGDVVTAERVWRQAATDAPDWALPRYYLGLLLVGRGEDIRQANRDRVALFAQAADVLKQAAELPAAVDFPAPAQHTASLWREYAEQAAGRLALEPPDAEVTERFVFRFDRRDRRFEIGPTLTTFKVAFDRAYAQAAALPVFLEPTEVLIYPDSTALVNALPDIGANRRAYVSMTTVGRRVYASPTTTDLENMAAHELGRVVVHVLTQDGLAPPLWITEGIAAVMERSRSRSDRAERLLTRGDVLPLDQLNNPEWFFRTNYLDQAMGQSKLMVEALLRRLGTGFIVPYLHALGWGTSPDEAFRALTGLTQDAFLHAFLAGQV